MKKRKWKIQFLSECFCYVTLYFSARMGLITLKICELKLLLSSGSSIACPSVSRTESAIYSLLLKDSFDTVLRVWSLFLNFYYSKIIFYGT